MAANQHIEKRIAWYVERMEIASHAIGQAFPLASMSERLQHATSIACTESIVDDLETIASQLADMKTTYE